MKIRRASRNDLEGINVLTNGAGWANVPKEFINKRDIAIVAVDENKTVQGFVWVGLMAQNTCGYVEWFVVNPKLSSKGIGHLLMKRMTEVSKKLGVKMLFGTIRQNESHNKSAANALKIGMLIDKTPSTIVMGQVNHMSESLGV